MKKEIIINAALNEVRIAITENGDLAELFPQVSDRPLGRWVDPPWTGPRGLRIARRTGRGLGSGRGSSLIAVRS